MGDMQKGVGATNGFTYEVEMSFNEADTKPMGYQIAGHTRIGILKHSAGYLLKPIQKEPLGSREVKFYQDINRTTSELNILLKGVLPHYYGVGVVENGTGEEIEGPSTTQKHYLVMEDIVQGFESPCIVDIKIGKKTWDPSASTEKIAHEKTKYTGTKPNLGISIAGMHYFDLAVNREIRTQKSFGKELNEISLVTGLEEFLNSGVKAQRYIAKLIVQELLKIKRIFESQTKYLFFASSVLIAYDAEYIRKLSDEDKANNINYMQLKDWLRVWMIDFAHVFPAEGQIDENYIEGLNNIIDVLCRISSGDK